MKLTEIQALVYFVGWLSLAVIVLGLLVPLVGTDEKASPIDPPETKELP